MCTLTETQDGHTSTVRVTVSGPGHVTIPGNGAATADFVDTYTTVPGKLRVEKTIDGPGAGRQGTVRIQVSCDGTVLPDWVIPAGSRAGTRAHIFGNLAAGSICTVNETSDGHSSMIRVTVTGDGQRVPIAANATATAKLTDRYTIFVPPPPPFTG
jgi:hypothetical protein